MGPYTDLHLHLIPDVDDGPASEEEAVELARLIVADGVTQVAVTPHFNAWRDDLLSTRAELDEHVDKLRSLLQREGVDLIVHPGAEHFLNQELLDRVKAGTAPTLADGPYILVELPFSDRPLYADDYLFQLGLAGLQPVLAHPERYSWVVHDPESIEPLVARGINLQLTAASLLGSYGNRVRKTAEQLLRFGFYKLVGSDIHHPGQHRALSAMDMAVRDLIGAESSEILFTSNPDRVLRGEPLMPLPDAADESGRKRLFGLFG